MRKSIGVRLERRTMFVDETFDVARELQAEFGERSVYLLESLGGPDRDRERAIIGIGPLVTAEVLDRRIDITGDTALREALWGSLREAVPGLILQQERAGGGAVLDEPTRLWDVLREITGCFDVPQASDARPDFGFLTVLSYDAVQYIEALPRSIPRDRARVPDLALTLYASILEVDLRTGAGTLTTSHSDLWEAVEPDRVVAAAARATARAAPGAAAAAPETEARPHPSSSDAEASPEVLRDDYLGWVDVALEHIRDGDVYQVQLGYDVTLDSELQPWEIYARMRRTNPSPFMGMLPLRDTTLLSASPELHVLLQGGGATMRPIAGTSRRTGDECADEAAVHYLRTAEKEHAEHIMLVDLCRNDLGRVAVPGSVRTPVMMAVEPYSHVFHLVSTVTATVEPGFDVFDVIRATFPAGTMTGAPKVRAMEVIESLESSPRGLYAGVFGVIGIGGYANLALTIRSVFCSGNTVSSRASAGIVADSVPQSEWDETRAKLSAAVEATTGGILA
ncbi:anthranilate synthase component I family protein [Nocardiopsis metallicus]|uniref:Anthranilate synthase component 1 n=1 Tax=Nocardiopsis metallicus TaxID=179819 RepID=A0A840VY83_9ACTN|nr:anthranilate synthase component I family protein [Nocardiopsis metallicus]MBB5489369.1 anthranilate synthase component 1 [Nocardiopsis metallicus]